MPAVVDEQVPVVEEPVAVDVVEAPVKRRSCRSMVAPSKQSLSHPGAVVEVGERSFVLVWRRSGNDVVLAHSPTDAQGRRRYYNAWWFKRGQVALLRHAGSWVAEDAAALVLAKSEGMGEGYEPVVLRHGLHAAVLLGASDGGPTWFQPYLAPCPE